MKKIVLNSLFLFSFLNATTIGQIVDSSLENNHELKALEKSIEVANENITLSQDWKNPVLSIGVNDIQISEPFKRDLEPMQTQFVGISQVIPYTKKQSLKKSINTKDKHIQSLKIENKKLLLTSKIYELSYEVVLLEKELKLYDKYKRNLKKLKKLSSSFYKYGKSDQNEVLNVDISLKSLEIKKRNISSNLKNLYLKLEELSFLENINIKEKLEAKKLVLNMDISSHPSLVLYKKQMEKYKDISSLEKENKHQDLKLNIAYFNRFEHEDYINVSVNIPLSIYKSEDKKALIAKHKSALVNERFKHKKREFSSTIKLLQNNINDAYSNYKAIYKSIIPIKRKIQRNLQNYNSYNEIKPQMLIKNLNELITFELEVLRWQKIYFKNYAKTKYYESRKNQ